jgi:hypothetical protein
VADYLSNGYERRLNFIFVKIYYIIIMMNAITFLDKSLKRKSSVNVEKAMKKKTSQTTLKFMPTPGLKSQHPPNNSTKYIPSQPKQKEIKETKIIVRQETKKTPIIFKRDIPKQEKKLIFKKSPNKTSKLISKRS